MRVISFFLVIAGVLALAGCKDTDRPLTYNKGVYAGEPDTELSDEQVDGLRQRGKRIYQ